MSYNVIIVNTFKTRDLTMKHHFFLFIFCCTSLCPYAWSYTPGLGANDIEDQKVAKAPGIMPPAKHVIQPNLNCPRGQQEVPPGCFLKNKYQQRLSASQCDLLHGTWKKGCAPSSSLPTQLRR